MNLQLGTGLYKSPYDERDFLYTSFDDPTIPLPLRFDKRSEWMPPVRNQKNEGSCAGHNARTVKVWQEKIDHKKYIEMSVRFVYELAKRESGHSEGTTLKAICKVLTRDGICEESYWPYIAGEVGKAKEGAYENAKKYKISGYARITTMDELKRAIYRPYPNGGLTLMGMLLYKGISSQQSIDTGVCPDPSCWDSRSPVGGHAITPCGWDDDSVHFSGDGHIVCQGSWGDKFGDDGYHYFSYTNLKKNMMDCTATIDINTQKPITVASLPRNAKGLWV